MNNQWEEYDKNKHGKYIRYIPLRVDTVPYFYKKDISIIKEGVNGTPYKCDAFFSKSMVRRNNRISSMRNGVCYNVNGRALRAYIKDMNNIPTKTFTVDVVDAVLSCDVALDMSVFKEASNYYSLDSFFHKILEYDNIKHYNINNNIDNNIDIWRNKEGKVHRDGDLPAVIVWSEMTDVVSVKISTWFNNGKMHRIGNPAYISTTYHSYNNDTEKEYFIDDIKYDYNNYWKRMHELGHISEEELFLKML